MSHMPPFTGPSAPVLRHALRDLPRFRLGSGGHSAKRRYAVNRGLYLSASEGTEASTIWDTHLRGPAHARAPAIAMLNSESAGFAAWSDDIGAERPSMYRLLYTSAQRLLEGTKVAGDLFDEGFEIADEIALIRTIDGEPKIIKNEPHREIWLDITKPATRAWLVPRLVDQLRRYRCHGYMLDNSRASLYEPFRYVDGTTIAANWKAGAIALFNELREASPPGTLIGGNILWSKPPGSIIAEQADLLPYVDYAFCESFYADGLGNGLTAYGSLWSQFVRGVGDAVIANPRVIVHLRGTMPDVELPFLFDLQCARASLVAAMARAFTPRMLVDYGAILQINRLNARARSTTYSEYIYWRLAMGEPVEDVEVSATGGESRRLHSATIYIAPQNSGLQTWVLERSGWLPDGTHEYAAGDTFKLVDGDAQILLDDEPDAPPATISADLTTRGVSYNEHIVERITREHRYDKLHLRVKGGLDSAVLVRFMSDSPPFGVLCIKATGGTYSPGTGDIPYGTVKSLSTTRITSPTTYAPDGQYHDLVIDLSTECSPYNCYQVMSVRLEGDAELDPDSDSLYVSDPVALNPYDASKPTGQFTAAITFLSVTFTEAVTPAAGTSIVSRSWSFGDGATSTSANPTHVYASSAPYVVSCTWTADNGKTFTYTRIVVATEVIEPAFRDSGAGQGTVDGAVVPWPFGHDEGDFALLIVQTRNEAVTFVQNDAGFVEVAGSPQGTGSGAGACRLTVFRCVATSDAMTDPELADAGNHIAAQILTFKDCRDDDPIDISAGAVLASADTAVSIPGGTTTTPFCLIVAIVAHSIDASGAQVSGWTNASLASITEVTDVSTASGGGGGFGVAVGVKETAGAYNATTATLGTASAQGLLSIALLPRVDSGEGE